MLRCLDIYKSTIEYRYSSLMKLLYKLVNKILGIKFVLK